ncbi:BURP domain-containing protein 12 [Ananas comosus]|uniref:BURP domain-containing protein 12 n=1 Tax=Ananas comosus TaxID=4615 RepID=A0A199VDT2_ANACO|nr:BURP domain-containing protein 12 [Ananas comosus]
MALPLSSFLRLLIVVVVVVVVSTGHVAGSDGAAAAAAAAERVNPFTARAALIRYWNRKVPNNRPHPSFFVSKLSPLSALDSATFSSLLPASSSSSFSSLLPSLCSKASLLCPSLSGDVSGEGSGSGSGPGDFAGYDNSNFTNYGTDAAGGATSFANYSGGLNIPVDSFRRYSRDSAGHNDSFASYEPEGNVVTANFTSYGAAATGGAGSFAAYAGETNVPDLRFSNYDAESNGRAQSFAAYSGDANAGDESFSGYGKNGNGVPLSFSSYGNNTNVLGSAFANYGENGNGATDAFASYGANGNVPENLFRSYGAGGNAGSDRFSSYRDQSNVGDDSFASYAKGANAGAADFESYGRSFNEGSDSFKGYGEGTNPNHEVTFASYFGDNTTFKSYAKSGIDFKGYHNSSSSSSSNSNSAAAAAAAVGSKKKSRWAAVEAGRFFRERELARGTEMAMPDIRDRLPPRAFLPRAIAARIPFAAAAVRGAFAIPAETALGRAVADAVAECERPPSRGETKRCATSAEDVIDFAVEVLGSDVVVRSTESPAGAGGPVVVGEVRGVNGGAVTRSVSCHQSLFPYLVYYCHSVPKVRVYEADILAVRSRQRINRGVAICHLDTSDWSAAHGAFVALGGKPGEIEVCHWIFPGDMTWTVAD